jgi:hypothetical protein
MTHSTITSLHFTAQKQKKIGLKFLILALKVESSGNEDCMHFILLYKVLHAFSKRELGRLRTGYEPVPCMYCLCSVKKHESKVFTE